MRSSTKGVGGLLRTGRIVRIDDCVGVFRRERERLRVLNARLKEGRGGGAMTPCDRFVAQPHDLGRSDVDAGDLHFVRSSKFVHTDERAPQRFAKPLQVLWTVALEREHDGPSFADAE